MAGQLPGYVLHDLVGAGAASEVWRAEAVGSPGRLVAVKRMAVGADRHTLQALSREADALTRLSHPSILQLLDVVPDGDGVALVMPYAVGGSLARRLANADGGLPAATVADVGARLGAALAAAHNAGLVHRDVKPANILFDAEGQALLADFGTARLTGELTPMAGTAEYLDPAVLAGQPPDARTDVYGLGVTLFEALAGVPPYAGSTARQTLAAADRGIHVPLAQLCDAPAVLATSIERAIRRDPTERFATASEFAGHLDEARRMLESSTEGVPPAPAQPPRPPGSNERSAGTLGAVSPQLRRATEAGASAAPVRPPQAPLDGGRSQTAAFGQGPPQPLERTEGRPGVDPRLLVVAAALALLIPIAVVVWLVTRDDTGVSLVEVTNGEAADPPPDQARDPGGGSAEAAGERIPASPCDDVEQPDGKHGEVLLADVGGRGCSVPVVWDGEQLLVLSDPMTVHRYDFGAEPDDVVLMGDWSCDGRDSPGLYRPDTGEVFLFDAFVGEGEQVTVTGDPTGVRDGVPLVLTDAQGCDRIEVVD